MGRKVPRKQKQAFRERVSGKNFYKFMCDIRRLMEEGKVGIEELLGCNE